MTSPNKSDHLRGSAFTEGDFDEMRNGQVLAERFVIDRLSGSGGMGEVYRASDRDTGQIVAVKVLRGEGPGDIARFEREARILSEIDDPRVVRHVAHGTAPSGDPYLVMEWLEGEDLSSRLGRGRLSPAESVALCTSIAEVLGILHDRGIVHRDLKPSNVFLVNGHLDHVKLLDFGIAQIQASTRMTGTGTLIGTFGYMAPEQASGAKDIDERVDVFALGCVLFECIAGEPAFGGAHPMAILTKILFEATPRLNERRGGVPVELDALVSRLLEKNRDERPRDGRTVAHALRTLGDMPGRALEETAVLTYSPSLTHSEQRALAVILVSAPALANGSRADEALIEAAAAANGATLERLLDGSLALLVAGTGVATDLAAQAARCALAVGACASGRRVVLAMGRGHGTGTLPVGPAIDQAALLLGGDPSESGVVALDDAAVGLLDARFTIRDESGVYILSGERDVAEVRTLLGKPTPCVGRERELRTLEGLFDDSTGEEPRPQVALVTAPPGVGKSRLGREFLQKVRARGEPVSIWIARGEQLRAGSAFAIASQLVESAAHIRGGEPLDVRREKLRARASQHVPESERRRVTEFLGEMIGAPFPADDSLPLRAARGDAQLMNDQVRAAFLDFVAAEAKSNAVLIFIEDLHWGDAPTVEVLGRALGNLVESPLFVLALARPLVHEVFPTLWSTRSVQEIRMNELAKKASERLVRHVLGERVAAEKVQKIVALSAGNAFYLEELIRATAEGRGDDLPETVVAMVQSRLGALSDAERRTLRAASIFGETFWTGSVAALLGGVETAAGKVEERFRALVEKEVFLKHAESRFPHETEYAFRHALLREGAYALLTDEDRALGHRLAGEWLERMGEEDPVVPAEHFEKGGELARAGGHWALAAERAFQRMDTERCILYADRGLACPVPIDVRNGLLGTLCHLRYFRIETLAEARTHAKELHQASVPGGIGWAFAMLVELVLAAQGGNMEAFAAALQEMMATEVAPEAADAASHVFGIGVYLLDLSGSIAQANAVFEKLEALARISPEQVSQAMFMYQGIAALRLGNVGQDPWASYELCRTADRIAEAIGHRRFALLMGIVVAVSAWLLGAYDEARHALVHVEASDAELGLGSSFRPFALAWLLADSGELAEARDWATRLVAFGQSSSMPIDEARGHWVLAEVLRRSGEFDAADTDIQAGLSMLRMVCPLDVPGALATQAALRLAQGRPLEALSAAEEGITKMEAMGACSQFFRDAFLRLVHAECLEATGNHDAATAAIAKARDYLLAVAAKIVEPAYRKSYLENVPENRRILELAEQWRDGT